MMLLSVQNIDVGYGDSLVCQKVSLEVGQGEVVCLLGRNGVGKTTLLKSVIKLVPFSSGRVTFLGKDVGRLSTPEVVRLGIGYVPQGRHIFADLTVGENLRLGTISTYGKCGAIPEEVFQYFPILKERLNQKGGTLSGGQQQMLAIGRALAGRPRLVLLDEPSEGIQPNIVESMKEIIRRIAVERNIAFLLVEQNLSFALDISQRGYVMSKGSIVLGGNVGQLLNDQAIKEYLVV